MAPFDRRILGPDCLEQYLSQLPCGRCDKQAEVYGFLLEQVETSYQTAELRWGSPAPNAYAVARYGLVLRICAQIVPVCREHSVNYPLVLTNQEALLKLMEANPSIQVALPEQIGDRIRQFRFNEQEKKDGTANTGRPVGSTD